MTCKLNNAQNSPVINLQSVSWTFRVKPNLTVYDKVLCKNKGPLTVSDDQRGLPVGSRWENAEFLFPPISIKPFPFQFPWN